MRNKVIRKSNALVEASYRLYASEKRVILFLASMIQPDEEDFKSYIFSIKEFAKIAELKHKGEYSEVKEITRRLISRVLEIQTPTGLLQTSWLSSAEYIEGSGKVILKFDSKLKPYLLQLKDRYTKYGLAQVIRLKSIYSIRIYELLKQYEKIGERSFLVEELRQKLGIEPGQYVNYNSLKVYVLTVAQVELKAKTDVSFEFEEIKIGRKVGKIRFSIKSTAVDAGKLLNAENAEIIVDSSVAELEKLMFMLPGQYQKQKSIRSLVVLAMQHHGYDYVARNIAYTNNKSKAAQPGSTPLKDGNYRNYLSKALKGDFGLGFHEDLLSKKDAEQLKQAVALQAEKQKRQEFDQMNIERENRKKAQEFIRSFAPETIQNLEQEALLRMPPNTLQRCRLAGSIENSMFKRKLEDVVMEHTGIRPKLEPQNPAAEIQETLEKMA